MPDLLVAGALAKHAVSGMVAPHCLTSKLPGKQTRTARHGPAARIGSDEPASRGHEGDGPVEDWMLVALRPDLHQTPILRKSLSEVGLTDVSDAHMLDDGAPMPGPVQARAGSVPPATDAAEPDAWQHLIGEDSTPVGAFGRVDAPRGLRLRKTPGGETRAIMPFDTLVHVERRTHHGWCYVVALGDARGGTAVTGAGFVEEQHLAMNPPEPDAHLHWVEASGERLEEIASLYYWDWLRECGRPCVLHRSSDAEWTPDKELVRMSLYGVNRLERIENIAMGVRRWMASRVAWELAQQGIALPADAGVREVLSALGLDVSCSIDAELAIRGLLREQRELGEPGEEEVPGFRGPDVWY